ncbi:hypothetical protein CL616_00985 [archaeon]|nr:hypothetical protein [archaeon]
MKIGIIAILVLLLVLSGCKGYSDLNDFSKNEKEYSLEEGEQKLKETICESDIYNCADFETQSEAQEMMDLCGGIDNDIHELDEESNGIACEDLPLS